MGIRKNSRNYQIWKALILVVVMFSVVSSAFGYVKYYNILGDELDDRIIHISFDDVYLIFEDLTENEDSYTSIFDNELLGYLQKLHQEYGAVFSFYCFYEGLDGFLLSDCTHKFASEFESNRSWLKFGFHAFDSESNLASISVEQISEDYLMTVSQLEKIVGGV